MQGKIQELRSGTFEFIDGRWLPKYGGDYGEPLSPEPEAPKLKSGNTASEELSETIADN